MTKVHFKKRGARRTVCGIPISRTVHDTTKASKTTCLRCKWTEDYGRAYTKEQESR